MGCRYPVEVAQLLRAFHPISASGIWRRALESELQFAGTILSDLGWDFVGAVEALTARSPTLDLTLALFRVWHDVNRGHYAEARLTPKSEPIYTLLTEAEAKQLQTKEPPPELVARLFKPRPIEGLH